MVTWPEGNGWLARELAKPLGERIRSGSVVFNIEQHGDDVFVDSFDVARERSTRLRARGVAAEAPYGAPRIGRALKAADAAGASRVVIVGPDEWKDGNVTVKDLASGAETIVRADELS